MSKALLRGREANQRAATISERNSLVRFSAERCLGGPSRSCHGEGNRQQPGQERLLDLSGVVGGGTFRKKGAEQERPSLAAKSGEDRAYKAGRLKSCGAIPRPSQDGLGVSTRTVCLWAECKELPAIKIGLQWRFREGELSASLQSPNAERVTNSTKPVTAAART